MFCKENSYLSLRILLFLPTKNPRILGGFFGERKATLTEYLEKNVEKLALLRFSFDAIHAVE